MNCPSPEKRRRITTGVCFVLVLMVWAVFSHTLSFDFVNYDDDRYVYADPLISEGITLPGLHRILTKPHSSNWHPLTSLSHMLDCQMYALNPAGHHLSSLGLHAATVLLLFLVLSAMTGSLWRSAFVAALFAIHPLRAESVAWISERKDVLSGLFFMLTLGAYTRYARVTGDGWRAMSSRYLAVVLFFVLGLMSKPMLVTTPFILLLLDGWPLNRFQAAKTKRAIVCLFLEKIPLLLLAIASCVVTVWAQRRAISSMDTLSLLARLENAVLSYAIYIKQLIFPSGLAVLYPIQSDPISLWAVGISLLALAGITGFAVRSHRTRPYLLTGWLWYLGMLVPVIGIMQVGRQAHADRYTYLPQIGLGMIIVWLAGDWAVTRRRRIVIAIAGAAILLSLMSSSRQQTGYWKNSTSLWSHTLACTQNNPFAQSNLGVVLFIDGHTDEAIYHFEQALRLESRKAEIYNNLASAYADKERYCEAVTASQHALTLAKTQCEPAVVEGIRARLETYLAELEKQKSSPAQ